MIYEHRPIDPGYFLESRMLISIRFLASSIAPWSPGPSGHLALALAAEDLLPIGRCHQALEVQLAVDHLRLTWDSTEGVTKWHHVNSCEDVKHIEVGKSGKK